MEYYVQQHQPAVVFNFGKWSSIFLGLCVLVFLLELVAPEFMFRNFALTSGQVASQPWTVITHIFMHGGASHLLMNMFALFLFGFILEREIGSGTFRMLFFGAGVLAALGQMVFSAPGTVSVGASGAIFGVMGMLAILKPRMIVYANFIPVPMIVAVLGWGVMNLLMIGASDSIGHAAHFFGLLVGLGMGVYWQFIRKNVAQIRRPSRPGLHQFQL